MLLGTAGYLAPEQVNGDAVDSRADLFALGSILFEMLTGRRAFAREHTIDTLHAIVHDPPPGVLSERSDVPPALTAIVMRLLEKSAADRFQTAAALSGALEQLEPAVGPFRRLPPLVRRKPRRWPFFAAAASAILALVSVGWWLGRESNPGFDGPALTRFTWSLPEGLNLGSPPTISPDGRRIVFAGVDAAGSRLFVRRLESLETVAIAGSEGAKAPFWSPDSLSVGFFARGKLMKIALGGGAPVVICAAPDGRGGTWGRSGIIVFGPDLIETALSRVSAAGGPVEAATRLDLSQDENSHRWPVFLPDGIHFLYFVRSNVDERRGVYVGRIDRPATLPGSPLIRSEAEALFVPALAVRDPGVIFSVLNGRLEARRFDADRLALIGDAQTTDLSASSATAYVAAMLSVSAGAIAFTDASVPYGSRLASSARSGGHLELSKEREILNWPRLSPDGGRVALQRVDPVRGNPDIWVYDLARSTRVRVTTAPDRDNLPVWSPDGRQLAYAAGRFGAHELRVAGADGTGIVRVLQCPGRNCEPTDWSPDGSRLLVNVSDERGRDVWAVPIDTSQAAYRVLAETFTERDARFSHDGRWVAYTSEESGRPEVSVRSLSGPARRFVISAGGGDEPVWRRDGSELFFIDLKGRLRSVSVRPTRDGGLGFGVPVELEVPAIGLGHWSTQYDVSPDGERVYFLQPERSARRDEIGVITGWRALVR